MDYVKETLQRQSAAWLALLNGGETETESGETPRRRERTESAESEARRGGGEEAAVEYTAAPSNEAAERREGSEVAMTQAEQRELMARRERLTREVRVALREREGGEDTTESSWGRAAESLSPEIARWEAEAALREGRSALETADARAISRRFERDARRYDGGFIFY